MKQQHFLQPLYDRYFDKKEHFKPVHSLPEEWKDFSLEEKKEKSFQLLKEGELALLNGDLNGLKCFDLASQLNPREANLWYKQGLSLFEYGTTYNNEKMLKLAGKSFKVAINLQNNNYEYWWSIANLIFELGNITSENHYFNEAKDYFQKSIDLAKNEPKTILAELYWDYGMAWAKVANHSGEAIDVKKAIQAMRESFANQTKTSVDFWYDFGTVHMQMALLINDNRVYLQAVDYFKKSIDQNPSFIDGWFALAQCFTQLYINTLDEQYFDHSERYFSRCVLLNPKDDEFLLEWAQLLGESGKVTKSAKKLRSSIEKCITAHGLNPNEPLIIGQWVESQSLLGVLTNRLDYIIDAEQKIIDSTNNFPKLSELWYAYGMCMQSLSEYYNDLEYEEMAIEKYQTALSIDSASAETLHALANSFRKMGIDLLDDSLLQRADKLYRKAIQLKPSYPALTYDFALALLSLSQMNDDEDTIKETVYQFEQTLQAQNEALLQHPHWLFHYAVALDMLGDVTEEENHFLRAIEILHNVLLIDPDYIQIYYRLAVCYSHLAESSFEKNYFDQAFKYFELATKQNPEDDEVYLEWGLSLISFSQQNDYDLLQDELSIAENKLFQAARLGNQTAYYHIACLYCITDRHDEALQFLKKADEEDVLPPVDEMIEDEWLEGLQINSSFQSFLSYLQAKQQLIDGK